MNDLFDIAHSDVIDMIKIVEHKQFLLYKEKKGQRYIIEVNMKQLKTEKKLLQKKNSNCLKRNNCQSLNKALNYTFFTSNYFT